MSRVRVAICGCFAALLAGCSPEPIGIGIGWAIPVLAAEQPRDRTAFEFHWPVPSTVHVTEDATKRGTKTTASYDVTLRPSDEEGVLVGRIENYRIDWVDGMSAAALHPAAREQLVAMTAAIPGFLVRADGAFLGIADFDAFLDSMEDLRGPMPGLRAAMEQPNLRLGFERQVGRFWRAWVENWIGMNAVAGSSATIPFDAGQVSGIEMGSDLAAEPPRTERAFRGWTAVGGQAHVTWRLQWQPDAAVMRGLTGVVGADGAGVEGVARVRSTAEAVLDPATLQPSSAYWAEEIEVEIDGRMEHRLERREYSFDWRAR
ncbi:MAG: hypothetical protein KDE27_09890 [Planctomycetes bacterium]|nr:hypothetical protein [Planctomycetota bacterium]